MSSSYVVAEGYIEVDEEGPPEGEAIDIRGANTLIIILDDDADPMNSFYGDTAAFVEDYDATKFLMRAGEAYEETPDVFQYWFPICDTGGTAMVRYRALNSRRGV